jgi:hypothetical protein
MWMELAVDGGQLQALVLVVLNPSGCANIVSFNGYYLGQTE